MCFCDRYYFLITNKNSGEKQFISGNENLCEFFERRYTLLHLFHCLLKKEYVQFNDVHYSISYNSHPECERVRIKLVKLYGIEALELWKICPKNHRHLLPTERQ